MNKFNRIYLAAYLVLFAVMIASLVWLSTHHS
jgi:hypothetical protein